MTEAKKKPDVVLNLELNDMIMEKSVSATDYATLIKQAT